MKLLLRDKIVDLNDETEFHYFAEYLTWLEYKRLPEDNYKNKFRNVHNTIFNTGNMDFAKEKVYSQQQNFFKIVSDDNCIATDCDFGSRNNLFIYVNTYTMRGNVEDSVIRIPNKIYNTIKKDFDLIVISEDPLQYPESIYPSYLVLGTSKHNNFYDMIKIVKDTVTKDYDNVVIFGDSAHAGITISIANSLEFVTHAIVANGDVVYDFDVSPWVQEYITYLEKRKKLIDKGIVNDNMDELINNISSTRIRHIMKTFHFKKIGIDKEILDPVSYYNNSYELHYYYGKYDTDWMPFVNYIKRKNININIHEVDWTYNETQTHFLAPYIQFKVIPKFLTEILS